MVLLSNMRRCRTAPKDGRELGATAVIMAISLTMIVALVGLVVDSGIVFSQDRIGQGAVDQGVLAAAQDLPDSANATAAGASYVASNLGLPTLGIGTSCGANMTCYSQGIWTVQIATPYTATGVTTPANYIKIRACLRHKTHFTAVFGVGTVTRCVSAVATGTGGSGGTCALCVLGPSGTTLSSTGSGALVVNNGNIVINSTDASAVKITNSAGSIVAQPTTSAVFGITGNYSAASPTQLQPSPTIGYTPVPDPLASLAVPSVSGATNGDVSISGSANTTLNPGIYDKISSSSGGTITFNPGIYVIRNSLTLSHAPATLSPSIYGHGVLFYFACSAYPTPCASPGTSGATMKLSGGATADITAPSSGTYQGMSVFYDRLNTSTFTLTGASATAFTGTIYAKSGTISLTGPSAVATSFGSAVVAGSVIKTGSSDLTLNFDPNTNAPLLTPSSISLVA